MGISTQLISAKASSLLLALLLLAPAANAEPLATADIQPIPVTAEHEVEHWLNKLVLARSSLEYRGLVTFEHSGMLETLRLVQGVRDGRLIERLRYLSGEPREVISYGPSADCHRDASPLAPSALWSSAGQQRIQRQYAFILGGRERIADRETIAIELRPRDRHRLGVLMNLDAETGLPLKSILVGPEGRMLERYQFVELDFSPLDNSALQPESAQVRKIDNSDSCDNAPTRWQLNWIPAGFELMAVRGLEDGEMLVYSDGLNAFSVFVQQLTAQIDVNGRAIRGATTIYMDHFELADRRYTITVVGEIPDNTAQLIAGSIATKTQPP